MAKFKRTDKLEIKKEKSGHSLEKREEKKLRKLKEKNPRPVCNELHTPGDYLVQSAFC